MPGNCPSGLALTMHDNYPYRAWHDEPRTTSQHPLFCTRAHVSQGTPTPLPACAYTRFGKIKTAIVIDFEEPERTIVRSGTHYHIWHYRRDEEGTIRSMERDDTAYPTRRKANYALSDGRQYWKGGQVLQCVDGAFCRPMPEEMEDRGIPFGPKYVALKQLADQARSIRPALKHVRARQQREELDAAGRIRSLEEVKAELAQRQVQVDAELIRLLQQVTPGEAEGQV